MKNNETLTNIRNRRSIRSYKKEQISEEDLQTILEAGLYAPSAGNQHEWHFTVIQNRELLDRLNILAKENAKQIENEHIRKMVENDKFNIFYDAPTLIIVSGNEQGLAIESDCAAANQNMLLAAESLGLGSCWINLVLFAFMSEDAESLCKELGIPEGYRPYCSAIVGYKKVDGLRAPARDMNKINYIK